MSTPLSAITGLSIDSTNPSDPILKIPKSSIAAAIGWTGTNTDSLDAWITALLQTWANYNTQNPTVETGNLTVSQPSILTPTTRNGVSNRLTTRYLVTVYSESTVAPVIDGDNL